MSSRRAGVEFGYLVPSDRDGKHIGKHMGYRIRTTRINLVHNVLTTQ